MATRSIVTSHPDVACDVCGRRLLRGEQPDVFLGGGQRRMVCELCVPRATHEGWLREAEERPLEMRPSGSRRTRSLLGRLRQLRESPGSPVSPDQSRLPADGSPPITVDARDYDNLYDFLDAPVGTARDSQDPRDPLSSDPEVVDEAERSPAEHQLIRALEVFNRSEHPRRVAGVARSLGAPTVNAAAVPGPESLITLVVAWDLCWYRYQVDLDDEQAGAQLQAQGMELEELPAPQLHPNAAADERGELSLLA
jgi:hypothetical protein